MTAREAEVRHCMGVRAIGIRQGSAPLDMAEVTASLCGTHTLVNSEEMSFCGYSRLLTFRDDDSLKQIHFIIEE